MNSLAQASLLGVGRTSQNPPRYMVSCQNTEKSGFTGSIWADYANYFIFGILRLTPLTAVNKPNRLTFFVLRIYSISAFNISFFTDWQQFRMKGWQLPCMILKLLFQYPSIFNGEELSHRRKILLQRIHRTCSLLQSPVFPLQHMPDNCPRAGGLHGNCLILLLYQKSFIQLWILHLHQRFLLLPLN